MSIPRFGPDATTAEVAAALRSHGCAVIERLADAGTCDALAAELAPWIDKTPTGADSFSGRQTRRTGALLARSRTAVDLIAHPLVLDVVDDVLGERKTTFQLHLTQAITIGPGNAAQPLHRDQWCFDFFPFPTDTAVEVSTIWALDEFTEANGATRICPGSHLTADGDEPGEEAVERATMPRGSVVLYTGRTVHGGGANTSDEPRTGINVDYTLGWLRQEENQYLSVPANVAAMLPERVQRLMGYAYGATALGYIDDVRDPIAVLRDDPSDTRSSLLVP